MAAPVAAALGVVGVVAAGALASGPPPVERRAVVAGGVDSLLPPVEVTTTVAPPATRPPATTAVTSSTVARRGLAVGRPPIAVTPAPSSTTVTVPPPTTTIPGPVYPPNGPAPPTVSVRLMGQMSDGTVTMIAGEMQDLDGWLRGVTIDWGDGTAPVSLDPMELNGRPCPMAGGDFPAGSTLSLPGDKAFHRYAGHAPRTITVTTTSTSCDGVSDRQTGVGRVVLSTPVAP